MSDNWVVQNLENALNTWNEKLAEIWQLITQSPQQFKGGTIWAVIVNIHGAVQAIGLALLVLFFVVGVVKTCGSFAELKKPEHALKLFIRFALAKGVVTYGLQLMMALFEIVQGLVSTIMNAAGFGSAQQTVLPQEIIDAIESCGFFESIPLWAVTLIGGLFITVLSFIMIMTVYHHEPIIDRSTWETVQKIRAGTKRRQPKNSEKNMFAGLLYCADCGHKLHYNINHPNSAIEYFNCSNYRGNRGTCNETHYVRADSLEQVVLLELNRMVSYLQENEEEFAELLARKTSQDYEREKRFRQQKLAELNARYSEVDMLFERTYEDNVSGKLSDERFMKLSQRYDEEQQSLKKEIAELESICDKEDSRVYSKNQFLKAVRKFMQMKTLTPTMLHELVERIDVYHIQGTGKNRTQRLVIHYKFVGVLDLPHSPVLPGNVVLNSRQGVEIEYLVGKAG